MLEMWSQLTVKSTFRYSTATLTESRQSSSTTNKTVYFSGHKYTS